MALCGNAVTFARGREALARKAAKASRPRNLVAKATGERIDKGKLAHLYSEEHLRLVRAQPCIVSRSLVGVVAHHPKEALSHLMQQGRKISDYFAIPLAHDLHDPDHPGSLHKSNSMDWWTERNIDVYRWLKLFLRRHYKPGHPGADYALEQIAIVESRRQP